MSSGRAGPTFQPTFVPRGGISLKEMNSDSAFRRDGPGVVRAEPAGVLRRSSRLWRATRSSRSTRRRTATGRRAGTEGRRQAMVVHHRAVAGRRQELERMPARARRSWRSDVRQGSLLHLDPRDSVGKESLDASVRRTSSGAEHHDCRGARRSDADADRRSTCALHQRRKDGAASRHRRATRRWRCSTRSTTASGSRQS